MTRLFYHTQEHRGIQLESPIICRRDDAWLGEAYYFWYDELDADRWGSTSKKNTGRYEIYSSSVDCTNVLDTVFNEEHYLFWLNQVEKAATKIIKLTKEKPTLKEINDYFKKVGVWDEVDGIMFQDLPNNFDFLLVKPIAYRHKQRPFAYRKRIQVAIYNVKIILTFARYKIENC
jgi:hypothetical protein